MLRLIIIAVVTITIFKMTTFGWQGISKSPEISPKDKGLMDRLKTHVVKLSCDIGDRSIFKYPQLTEAANYIIEQFKILGYKVEFQEYILDGKQVKNIIAKRIGKTKPEEVIIIGAHYDTCFNTGANDNASGVGALLELAKYFVSYEPARTIKFIAFVNEEPPFFKTENMGSFVYARKAKEEREDIKLAIILETIGYYSDKPFSQRYPPFVGPFYPNRANFIGVVGNFSMRREVKQFTKIFKRHSKFPIRSATLFDFVPGVDFSDHWSFWENGFPAIMITDTAFYRSSHYHINSDTFEKLDYKSLAIAVEGLEVVITELAG